MVISHNLLAMNAQRQFNITGNQRKKSTEKLASGYRINRSADDAAGLAISEKMRRQIKGLTQGTRNAQDGISMCQIADGALNEVSDMMHRLTELSVQSANGTNDAQDRQAIQQEVNALVREIDRVADTTTFNEQSIFTPSMQVGYQVEQVVTPSDAKQALINRTYSTRQTPYLTPEGHILSAEEYNSLMASFSNYMIAKDTWNIIDNGGYVYDGKNGSSAKKMQDMAIKICENSRLILPLSENPNNYHDVLDEVISKLEMYSKADVGVSEDPDTMSARVYLREANQLIVNYRNQNAFYSDVTIDSMLRANSILDWRTNGQQNVQSNDADLIFNSIINIYNQVSSVGDDYLSEALCSIENPNIAPNTVLLDNWQNNNHLSTVVPEKDFGTDNVCKAYNYLCQTESSEQIPQKQSIWIQSGAEAGDGLWLEFNSMNSDILGIRGLNVSTQSGAEDAISRVKSGLGILSGIRSDIGAQQNRLEHTIRHQENTIENTQQAESLIRDTDMAKEMVELSKQNILEQMGTSMITQANQSRQGVLSLLQ